MAELLYKLLLMDMFEGEAYWQVLIYLKEYAPELHDKYLGFGNYRKHGRKI